MPGSEVPAIGNVPSFTLRWPRPRGHEDDEGSDMSRRVAIAGVGLAGRNGKADGLSPYALTAESSRQALAEAGLSPHDVDGFASTGLGTLQPVDVAEYLGLRPRWVDSTSVGGAAWEVMAAHAADAIARGPGRRHPAHLRFDRPQ